jgi:hypothetical protein
VPPNVHVKTFGEISYEATNPNDEAAIYAVNQGGLGSLSQMMVIGGSPSLHINSTYFEVFTDTSQQVRIDQTGGTTSKVRYTNRGWIE